MTYRRKKPTSEESAIAQALGSYFDFERKRDCPRWSSVKPPVGLEYFSSSTHAFEHRDLRTFLTGLPLFFEKEPVPGFQGSFDVYVKPLHDSSEKDTPFMLGISRDNGDERWYSYNTRDGGIFRKMKNQEIDVYLIKAEATEHYSKGLSLLDSLEDLVHLADGNFITSRGTVMRRWDKRLQAYSAKIEEITSRIDEMLIEKTGKRYHNCEARRMIGHVKEIFEKGVLVKKSLGERRKRESSTGNRLTENLIDQVRAKLDTVLNKYQDTQRVDEAVDSMNEAAVKKYKETASNSVVYAYNFIRQSPKYFVNLLGRAKTVFASLW